VSVVPATEHPAEGELRLLHGLLLTVRAVGSSMTLLAAGAIALHAHVPRLITDTRQAHVGCGAIGAFHRLSEASTTPPD
jgi:hypothetical protein